MRGGEGGEGWDGGAVGSGIGIGEAYLTTLMAFGTRIWPLEGAIVVLDLQLCLVLRRLRRAGSGHEKLWRSGGKVASRSQPR